MFPVLIDLGGFQLYTYGALAAVGFLVVVFVALRDARRMGWDRDRVVDLIFWTSLAAIGGARGFFFLQNPATIEGWSTLVDMRAGGMVFYGAPLCGVPVGLYLLRRYGLPVWEVADTFARTLPVAHGLSRLGCFAAGCCYGQPWSGPWAVTFTHPLSAAPHDGVGRHPVQLYEAAGLFVISAVLFWWAPRKRYPGQVLVGWLGAYAVLRLVTEELRGDAERYFVAEAWIGQAVSTSQAVSLGLLGVVAGLAVVLKRR